MSWAVALTLVALFAACGSDSGGGQPVVSTSNGTAPFDVGGGTGGGDDTGEATPDTAASNGTPDTGEDTTPDTPDDCACAEGEVCVSNDTVEDTCFERDCPMEQCDAGEVCFEGACVSTPCAGLDCGGYPNVCRGGVCEIGSCNDPDVTCPDGRECVEDGCLLPCDDQAACGPLACIDGHCRPCELSSDCGGELICVDEQCVAPCDDDSCEDGEVCDADTGLCVPPCEGDGDCGAASICDAETGQCVPEECSEDGTPSGCEDGEVCSGGRCVPRQAGFVVGLCSGCEQMSSARYKAQVVLSPMEITAPVSASERYQMQSGTLSVLRGAPEE
ncbi:MAG: hypothetical protein CMH57_05145 [Myxococcales bacterium]|nr:hypothetical protein [Myxococcales bacterium]